MKNRNVIFMALILIVFLLCINDYSFGQTSWAYSGLDSQVYSFVENSSGIIFARGDTGLFRSNDQGNTWYPISFPTPPPSSIPFFSVTSLGIDDSNFLYLGTFYQGVFRSTNDGATWIQTATAFGNVSKFLEVSAHGLFVSTYNWGIFRSTDRGFSWTPMNNGITTSDVCNDIIIGPGRSLLVGTSIAGVFKSTDYGNTWIQSSAGLTSYFVRSLFMDPSNRIYAGTDDQGVFVSTDAGDSWTPANRGIWGGYVVGFYSLSSNQVLAVNSGGIHISSNGGQIWQQVNNGLSSLSAFCVIMNSLGEVLVGTGSGVFRRKQFLTVAPMPPSLLFPVDSSISVPLKIVISWNPSLTTDSYNIQIAKDQKFLQVAFEQSNILTTSLQVDSLSRMTQYYWRVCGTNSEGKGGWSNTWRFTTILPAITPPTLLSPSNRALAVVINPTLSWSRVIPSSAYAVQVDRDSGFSTIVFENHSIIDTSVNVSTLQSGTMYFWRVRTVRSDSVSVWSLPWQFTTDFTPPLDHFPLTIGNSWSIVSWYMSTPLSYTLKRVEMDTVLSDGKTYSAIRNYTRPANETSWTTQNWEYLRLEGSRLYEFPDSLIVDFDLTAGGCLPRGCIISDYRDSWLGRFSRILDISANYNPGSGYDWWSYVDSMGYGIMEESSFYNYYPVYTIGARINGVEYGSVFPVAVHDKDFLSPPTHFILYQNYPNPFNPVTTISFSLPIKSFVSLKIFDIMGRKVATIVSEELSAGTYSRQWNASNMSSGIYFYQLQAGSFIQTKKLILLR